MYSRALSKWRREFKARLNLSDEKDAALLKNLDQMCKEIRHLFKADNALKARLEMDYIEASGKTRGDNTLLFELNRIAQSTLLSEDKGKLIIKLCEGRKLDAIELAFARKAKDFAALAKKAERTKESDLKLLRRLQPEPVSMPVPQLM